MTKLQEDFDYPEAIKDMNARKITNTGQDKSNSRVKVWDIERGTVLDLGQNKEIIQAEYGCKNLTT